MNEQAKQLPEKYLTQDFRWTDRDGARVTWRQTLRSACSYYGTFSGRWHDNAYWKSLAAKEPSLSDEECEIAVRIYEYEADCALARWEAYQ